MSYVVLDEADEMLNMGFKEDIDTILEETPEDKRTWLFSATMPDEVARITKQYMDDPVRITVGKKNRGAKNIQHLNYVIHEKDRYQALKRILDHSRGHLWPCILPYKKRDTGNSGKAHEG